MGAERASRTSAAASRTSAKGDLSRSAKSRVVEEESRDDLSSVAGNLTIGRALAGSGIRAKLAVSHPGDPEEQEADRVADAIVRRSPLPPIQRKCDACSSGGGMCSECQEEAVRRKESNGDSAPGSARISRALSSVQNGGAPLSRTLRQSLEGRFARDFSGVRIHTDPAAAAAARGIGARAFTVRNRIAFAPGEFRPGETEGQRLLAHELAHVVQGSPFGKLLRKNGEKGDPGTAQAPATVAQLPAVVPPTDDVAVPVDVEGPGVGADRGKEDDKQRLILTTPTVKPPLTLRFYGVPLDKFRKAIATTTPDKPPAPPPTEPPAQVPSDVAHPVGSTATTLDGQALKVLASTNQHVITDAYTKYAVGAGSTSAVRLADGTVIVIDAGINASRMGISEKALSDLTMQKLAEFIGDSPIRELLISHAHADHTSLAPRILERFPVDTIRINSVQARWEGYKDLRKQMVDAQQRRIKNIETKFREDIAKTRSDWEAKQETVIDEGARQARWDKHVGEEWQKAAETIPGAKGARERILIQSKPGVYSVANVDIATNARSGTMPLGDQASSPAFTAEDPYSIRETQMPSKSKRVLDQRRKTTDADIDPNASAYVVTVGNTRFLVLPDIRASNMKALMGEFERATKGLGDAKTQIWDASHHMQKGWYAGTVPEKQLGKIIDFLWKYRARKGSDAVVVSAEADLRNPKAGTLVDPTNIWVLRSLGFEVYLATAGADVRVYNITTAQGSKLTGIAAPRAPGTGPPHITLARAKLALDKLAADKLTEETALSQETDAGKKEAIKKRIAEIDRIKGEVEAAYKECLAEIPKKFQAPEGGHTSQSLADAGKVDFPKQKSLDELLEKYKFDKPVTTDAHLTDVALVVLGHAPPGAQPAGAPLSRARQLAKTRSDIAEISTRIQAGEVGAEIRVELLTKLLEYRAIIDAELNPPDPAQKPPEGTTKQLLVDDLKGIDAKIQTLQEATSAKTFKRVGAQVIEQHTVVVKPLPQEPSKAAKVTGEALELAGRGMGLVMVISTVSGEGDLLKRWKEGTANKAEVAFGTAHNVVAGAVAVRMLRGVPVANEVFVVMALLDVGQAFARDYEREEERNIATAYTGISQAINLGLMAAGGVLMAQVEFPPAMVAGFLLTLAGPSILEALHVHDLLERWLEFNPSEVIEVNQDLRELMPKYRAIAGSIQLAERARKGDPAIVGSKKEVQEQADEAVKKLRRQAVPIEDDILMAFKRAYKDAKTNYAGLRELDQYRATFLKLRHDAGMEEYVDQILTTVWGQPVVYTTFSREDVEKRFKEMEQDVSLVGASIDEIHTMPQWTELDTGLDDLKKKIDADITDDEYHKTVRNQDARVQSMIDNARYRLDPRAQGGLRTESLVGPPGSPAMTAYEKELSIRERTAVWLRHQYLEKSRTVWTGGSSLHPPGVDHPDAPSTLEIDSLILMLEGSTKRFRVMVETTEGAPKEIVDGMFTSAEDSDKYREFIKTNQKYAKALGHLETTDAILESLVLQAKRTLAGKKGDAVAALSTRLEAVVQETKTLYSLRYYKRGIVYQSELDALRLQIKTGEVKAIKERLEGKDGVAALTPEQLDALKNDDAFGPPGKQVVPPVENRLWLVPGLSKLDANGNFANIYRVAGKGDVMVGQTFIKPFTIAPAENVLVGALAPPELVPEWGGQMGSRRRVMALNDPAIKLLQVGTEIPVSYTLSVSNLGPVKPDDLQQFRDTKQK